MWILAMTLLVSLVSFVGIFSLWFKEKSLRKVLFILVAFSTGALLSGGLMHLMVEALEKMNSFIAFTYLIVGFSFFFLIEKFLHWHHCHEKKCDIHPYTYLILFGDGIHNFIDGLVIAASFFVNPALGFITTLMIITHEVPQELGDFGVLLHGGMGKRKALLSNFVSQLTCVLGGMIGYVFSFVNEFSLFLLPFAAGGFIYIAASDLIPELHKECDTKKSTLSFIFFIIGVLLLVSVKLAFGH